jgi:hypothetical protein
LGHSHSWLTGLRSWSVTKGYNCEYDRIHWIREYTTLPRILIVL